MNEIDLAKLSSLADTALVKNQLGPKEAAELYLPASDSAIESDSQGSQLAGSHLEASQPEAGSGLDTQTGNSERRAKDGSRRLGPGSATGPTPFQQSPLAAMEANSEDPFFGQREPFVAIQHEQAHHRHIVDLKAQGFTNREIASMTGFSEVMVSNTVRQPWALERLANGVNAIRERTIVRMSEEVGRSFEKLIELRDDPGTPPAVIRGMCESHLDRIFGKATQPIAVTNDRDFDKISDEELAKMLPPTSGTANSQA